MPVPQLPANHGSASRLLTLIATILVVGVLYLARDVLIPIALAILLCFLLAPLVNRLQRAGVGRVPAVLAAALLSFVVITVVGYAVVTETINLANSLPHYRENIRERVRAIASPGAFSRAKQQIKDVTEEAMKATTQPESATTRADPATQPDDRRGAPTAATRPQARPQAQPAQTETPPLKVQVVEQPPNIVDSLLQTARPLLMPLGTAVIVIVFVIFMLIQREDLRDRIIRLIGTSQINLTTQVIDDAALRVSRYLVMQFIVNCIYGVSSGIGLMAIGVPNAALWGVLCTVLRYIPYIGPWLGAAFPIILSLAVFDDWLRPALVVGMYVALEVTISNLLEPLVYGARTGVSPLAVLGSAVFWGWLWGIPGLVLATPITVCVVVIGRYVPRMEWLAVLLGDEPGLPLPQRVYQRLLATDQEEVFDLAEEYLKTHSLLEWYDEVLAPALRLAEEDRHRGTLDEARAEAVFNGAHNLIDELGERPREEDKSAGALVGPAAAVGASPESAKATSVAEPSASSHRPLILIVAARDEADELAGLMLEQLLRREGRECELLPAGTLAGEMQDRAGELDPRVVCISAMPPLAVSHARYVCKRIRERLPATRLLVGLWLASDPQRATTRIKSCGAETVASTFKEALEKLRV